MIGKREWAVGDGFMNPTRNGEFSSHEAICVVNLSGKTAHIKLTVYFENQKPLRGFNAVCENERSNHIRLDKIRNEQGENIPFGVPYSLLIESDEPIIVQHSRMDVSQPAMTLMTTIAY